MFLTDEFNKNISESIKKALKLCSDAADEQRLPVFLIGGVVRDILSGLSAEAGGRALLGCNSVYRGQPKIGQENFDVDITVQGNAIDFARALQEKYSRVCVLKEIHDDFKTAKVLCSIDGEEINLDLASTRKETYPYPASLPVLEEIGCELYEDVIRRDFSINSMALSLNNASFCELVDYLNGYEDLRHGKIKALHPLSFVDDPTRIIRALKFSVRFGYELEEETQNLMQACLSSGQFDNLAGERVKLELKQAFNINRAECLERFASEDIYRLVDASLQISENIASITLNCQKIVEEYSKYLQTTDNIWIIYLGILLTDTSKEKISELAEKLYLSGSEEDILQGARILCKNTDSLKTSQTRFEVYEFFEKAGIEAILAFLAKNPSLKNKADLFLEELKDITINSNGNTLIEMGLTPSPAFGKILKEILKALINKDITSSEEEIEFIKNLSTVPLED